MPDVPRTIKPEPEPTLADKAAPVLAAAAEATRVLLTGDAAGRVRRPLLFVLVALGIVVEALVPVLGAAIAIPALLLLAFTDTPV